MGLGRTALITIFMCGLLSSSVGNQGGCTEMGGELQGVAMAQDPITLCCVQ